MLPRSVRFGYGMGSVATGTFGTVPGLMLLPYLTDTLGIAAGLAAVIVFLPKAWDVILNPIAGGISDRCRDERGPRRPFLIKAGLALSACFALLFASPDLGSKWADAAWVLVMFVACATAYAFFQVPYVAMPAEITDSYHERTRLMTWRVAILAFTIMLSGATAPMLRNAFEGRMGYRVMGVVIACLLVVGVVGAYRGTAKAPIGRVSAGGGSLRDQLRIVGESRDFTYLLGTFVLQALAVGAMLAGVDYMARWVLGDKNLSTVLFVCFVGPALLFTPLWSVIGKRIGKKQGYLISSGVLILAAVMLAFARSTPLWAVFTATALVGLGYAGIQVFPMAMMPDAAAVDMRRTGENRVGVFTGVWTAGETLGMAMGPGLYATILAMGGYISSDRPTDWTHLYQPDSALNAITWGFSAVPAVLVAMSLIPLWFYRLDEAEVSGA